MKKAVLSLLRKTRAFVLIMSLASLWDSQQLMAQGPCNSTVPAYTVNLTGQPAGVWSSTSTVRNSTCCAYTQPDRCVYFYLTLDPGSAGIQIDMIGADPPGSLFYQVDNASPGGTLACASPTVPGGQIKCINGAGPHEIIFCKPGGNPNVYRITSIAKPTFAPDTSIRIGCKRKIVNLGFVNSSVTWTAIRSSATNSLSLLSFYNTFLDSTNAASPTYSAPVSSTNVPTWVDYQVCGFPLASGCGYSLTVCDTIRVYNIPRLVANVTPTNPTFCGSGSVTFTANPTGGLAPYSYQWTVGSLTASPIGTLSTLTATTGNVYYVKIFDKLYNAANCPFASDQKQPIVGTPPTLTMSANQLLCKSNPVATASGTFANANSYTWTSSGTGSISAPNFTTTNYTPSLSDLATGSVVLSVTGSGGVGCGNITNTTLITYINNPTVTLSTSTLACFNSTTSITANATGGYTTSLITPYTYLWSNSSGTTTSNSITNVGPGNWSVIVYDELGCTGTSNVVLTAPPALNLNFNVTNVTVNGGNNGSATVTPGGGTPGYTYLWNTAPTATNNTISNLIYGVYTATITDANGCQVVGSTVVNEPRCLAFTSAVSSTNTSCYRGGDGVASVTVSGGIPAYSYTWSPFGGNASTANGLNAGVYTILISDSNVPACFQTANVTVGEPPILSTIMTHTNATTVGGNDGAAQVTPSGGTPGYTYLWNTAATSSIITNLTAGNYSVVVTDTKGCAKPDYVQINQPPCDNLVINVLINQPLCFGGLGSAQAFVSGAIASPTVVWSSAFSPSFATGFSSGPIQPGSYTVAVDTKTCSQFQTFDVIQPSALSLGLLPTNISCWDKSDGSINITVGGGTIPYSYTWTTQEGSFSNSEDLTGLNIGNYTVAVQDANGCIIKGTASITKPLPLTFTAATVNSVSCVNGNNGSISLNVSGGVAPYTYSWSSTPANTPSLSNLPAGGYTVQVTDANNCIGLPNPLIIGVASPDSVKVGTFSVACSVPGSSLTQVYTNPIGGIGSYSVSYNGGPYIAAGSPTMLTNGLTHTVLAIDANGCVSPLSQTLSILNEVKIDSVVFAKCYSVGTSSTQVTVYPSGGAAGSYSASFNNGSSYQAAGVYTVNLNVGVSHSIIVRDSRGCVSALKVISIPTVLNATAAVTSTITCFNFTNGASQVTASGGTGAYTYIWSPSGGNNSTATGLGAGNYSVTVGDANNCTITRTVNFVNPTQVTATAVATSNYNGVNVSCNGFADGTASVSANGGTGSYTYQWNTVPAQTAATATALAAGLHSVTVTDGNNCAVTTTVSLTQPTAAIAASASVTSNFNGFNISCFGSTNATAVATASNGTAPFTYTWNTVPAQTSATVTNIGIGTYTVSIADVNGCSVTRTINVTGPTSVVVTASVTSNYNGQNISCFGATNGSVSSTPTGGAGNYTYTWSPAGGNNATASGLGAGTYTIGVNDQNGCPASNTITLIQPTAVSATAAVTSTITCFNLTDGAAQVSASGGTGAYTYSWTPSGGNNATAINLGSGTYTVTVADVNTCTATQTVNFVNPTQVTATAVATSNYNGVNVSCNGFADGTASVSANGGTGSYTYQWNTVPAQTAATATALAAGLHSVTVTDGNSCAVTTTVSLTQPTAAIAASASVTSNFNGFNISCFGSTNATAVATASNGTAPFTYTWNTVPAQTSATVTNIGIGVYTVSIADVNGCSVTRTINVTGPTSLVATTSITSNYNGQNISCAGSADGSASVSVAGGTGVYSYTWSTVPSQSTASSSSLSAGTYTVLVNDNNGCSTSQTVALTQPQPMNAVLTSTSNYNGFNVSCFGYTNASIDISLSGGTGAYTYTWSNTANTQDISGIGAGNYSVVAMDVNGCTDTLNVMLTQPDQLVVTIDSISNFNGYNVSCFGSTNGTVFVSVSGGVPTYSYSWSNGSNAQNLNNVGVGSYFLTLSDLNSCLSGADTLLIEPPALTNTVSVAQPLCNGVSNGTVNFAASGGVAPMSYNWSNGATTSNIENVGVGTYSVVYTDANGCKDSTIVVVNEPQTFTSTKDVSAIRCYGDTTANVKININGGTLPYNYTWSNGSNTSSLSSVGSGTYILTATDANGCIFRDTTIVTQPDSIKLNLFSPTYSGGYNISTYNGNDGSITLNVEGGTSPYNYIWSNGATTKDLSNLTAYFPNPFPYTVIVTDSNGCQARGTIFLNQPLILEMPTAYSPNGDGKNDNFVVRGIEAYPDNVITIFNRWGNVVYSKSEYKNEWDGNSNKGDALPDGTYFVILEISKGTEKEIILKGYVELRRY
jgi:large repetitive protein